MSITLPSFAGYLPLWLLLTSAAGIFNIIACYTSPTLGGRLFQGPAGKAQVSGLSSRLFATWTLTSTVVRMYAAFNLDNKEVYALAFLSYIIVWQFFLSEWLVYGTVKAGREIVPSFIVSTVGVTWMLSQWSFYTGV